MYKLKNKSTHDIISVNFDSISNIHDNLTKVGIHAYFFNPHIVVHDNQINVEHLLIQLRQAKWKAININLDIDFINILSDLIKKLEMFNHKDTIILMYNDVLNK